MGGSGAAAAHVLGQGPPHLLEGQMGCGLCGRARADLHSFTSTFSAHKHSHTHTCTRTRMPTPCASPPAGGVPADPPSAQRAGRRSLPGRAGRNGAQHAAGGGAGAGGCHPWACLRCAVLRSGSALEEQGLIRSRAGAGQEVGVCKRVPPAGMLVLRSCSALEEQGQGRRWGLCRWVPPVGAPALCCSALLQRP